MAVVDLEVCIEYQKHNFSALATSRQRYFEWVLYGTNKGLKALKGYEVQVSVPKPIVLQNTQMGKTLPQNDDSIQLFQFPISQENPLPPLMAGKRERIAHIVGIVHDHNIGQMDQSLGGTDLHSEKPNDRYHTNQLSGRSSNGTSNTTSSDLCPRL